MEKLETKLITSNGIDQFPSELHRLFTDLRVGGIILKSVMSAEDCGTEIVTQDRRTAESRSFRPYIDSIREALQISGKVDVQHMGYFVHEHDWHLTPEQTVPSVRFWTHLRGVADLMISRSLLGTRPGYGMSDQAVTQESVFLPTVFRPEPLDALLFVDGGVGDVTGTSSFHRVSVPEYSHDRLSASFDVRVF